MQPTVGRIKAGKGTLIGNAGEYYVVAELLTREVVAALAPRNSPAFDILATKEDSTVRIRVKTKSHGQDPWQWVAKKDGTIFRDIHQVDDFTVLVNLAPSRADLAFFIVPTPIVDRLLREDFEEWARTPGRNGRPHDATNKLRHLSSRRWLPTLEPYREAWDSLWLRITAT